MRNVLLLFSWVTLFFISGCTVGPDFVRPEAMLHEVNLAPDDNAALASPVTTGTMPNRWWELFNDPLLNSLQERAHSANLDLQKAGARIEQSRASLGIVTAALLPSAEADGSYARQGLSENGPMAALGAPTFAQSLWQGGFGAIWEPDLWGRNRRMRERASALRLSKVYEKELVHVAMSAEVAGTYIALRGTQSQLDLARQKEQIARDILKLTNTRQANGVAATYEVASAESELAQSTALVIGLSHQCDVLMNSLALLLALPPGSLAAELAEHGPIPALPPSVPVGLPSELARRRPDIRQAEENLHAATAAIGVAEADFYPSITLSASLGVQSFTFNDMGFWDSRWFSTGPGIHIPLFQGGRLLHELELTKSEQVEAALEYRKTVLEAWHEIDNALRLLAAEQKGHEQLSASCRQSERAFNRVRRSYQEGESSYMDVLTAQREFTARQAALQESVARESTALDTLYKTVGGGWDDEQLIHA